MADSKPRPGLTGATGGRRTFSTAFRGFDQEEVKAYLEELAKEFHELRERIAELEGQVKAAQDRPAIEEVHVPKLDVTAITNALGEETARVLRTATEAADDLRARAEEGATKALRDAHEEAARVRADAEALLARRTAEAEEVATRLRAEADEAAAKVRAEAEEAATSLRSEAKEEAERTIAEAIEQGRDMLSQAQGARERVLADLGRRRKVGLAQIERLRGGREQLSATLTTARGDIDRMIEALAEADEEARRVEEAMGPVPKGPVDEVVIAPGEPAAAKESGEPQEAGPKEAGPKEPGPTETSEAKEDVADKATAAAPVTVTEEVGAVVAGAAAPLREDTGTAAAPVAPEVPAATGGEDAGEAAEGAGAGSPPPRAPYKHDRVPAAVLPEQAVGGAPEERPKVDELFARLRTDRTPKEEGAAVEEEHEEGTAPAREDHTLEAPRSDEDESFLQRRDALIDAPLASTLRAVKRGLADEQNLALERLRKSRTVTLDAVLDDEAAHVARVSRWAAAGLAAVARAGASLAGKPEMAVPEDVVAPAVARLAEELVTPVRQRVATVIEEGGPDMADRLNSAYREARARVDRMVGDAVTLTVSNAFVAANAQGTPVRWVVDDPDGPCPDCDDNALAGPTPLGQPFPTGQVAPPAHPGCRCVLAPANT